MKKLYIILLVAVIVSLFSHTVRAEKENDNIDAYSAFMNLPQEVLPIIDKSTRFEMLEYFRADSIYNATNKLNGISRIDSLTNDFIDVMVSEASHLSIKILPGKKGEKYIGVIYTFDGPAADSKLYFFDESFNALDTEKYFKAPKLKEFFDIPKGSITKTDELVDMISFPTIEYRFYSNSNDLSLKLTVGEHINQDDYNIMKLFLLPEVTYEWQNNKYKKLKSKK